MSGETFLIVLLAALGIFGPVVGVGGHHTNESVTVDMASSHQSDGLMTPLMIFIPLAFLAIFALLVKYKDRLDAGSVDVEAYRDTMEGETDEA